jgi:hypothetical protein
MRWRPRDADTLAHWFVVVMLVVALAFTLVTLLNMSSCAAPSAEGVSVASSGSPSGQDEMAPDPFAGWRWIGPTAGLSGLALWTIGLRKEGAAAVAGGVMLTLALHWITRHQDRLMWVAILSIAGLVLAGSATRLEPLLAWIKLRREPHERRAANAMLREALPWSRSAARRALSSDSPSAALESGAS